MKISSLLNPAPTHATSKKLKHRHSGRRRDQNTTASDRLVTAMPKQLKLGASKDAPRLIKGKPTGEVRFPPHPADTSYLQRQHRRFHIKPSINVDDYPRHIPYSSDKIGFFTKTGREAFEVFEYSFRFDKDAEDEDDSIDHGKGTEWTVRWDYNIGLVRITPFFKALGLSKTAPNHAILDTPDLKELCHSITGGSLVAQGYWVPFAAAKAMAATFCWKLRYALTPLFGVDFLDMCIPPEDPAYTRHTIEESIVKACAEEVKGWRSMKKQGSVPHPRATKRVSWSPESTPETKMPQTRPLRRRGQILNQIPDVSDSDSEMSYRSSASSSVDLPQKSTPFQRSIKPAKNHGWNAVNQAMPQMAQTGHISSSLPSVASSPMFASSIGGSPSTKRTYTTMTEGNDTSVYSPSSDCSEVAPKNLKVSAVEMRAAVALLDLRYGLSRKPHSVLLRRI